MAELQLFWLLLPIAALSGWWMAKRSSAVAGAGSSTLSEKLANIEALNWDQTRHTVDSVARRADSGAGSVDTQFAVAEYFRRSGEVDRAVRIHRELANQSGLSSELRHLATLELGVDYLRSGLFDRAEPLFQELIAVESFAQRALRELMDLYQQEQDWEQAINCAEQLQRRCGIDTKAVNAHFFCERAEQLLAQRQVEAALLLLRQAAKIDPRCVRVSFIEGNLALQQGDHDRALAAYLRVETQDIDFVVLALPRMLQCYRALDRLNEFRVYLSTIARREAGGAPSLLLADLIAECEGVAAALQYLAQQVRDYPSLHGVEQMLRYLHAQAGVEFSARLAISLDAVQALVRSQSGCRCRSCGFESKSLYWQCPGCKHWASVKPCGFVAPAS